MLTSVKKIYAFLGRLVLVFWQNDFLFSERRPEQEKKETARIDGKPLTFWLLFNVYEVLLIKKTFYRIREWNLLKIRCLLINYPAIRFVKCEVMLLASSNLIIRSKTWFVWIWNVVWAGITRCLRINSTKYILPWIHSDDRKKNWTFLALNVKKWTQGAYNHLIQVLLYPHWFFMDNNWSSWIFITCLFKLHKQLVRTDDSDWIILLIIFEAKKSICNWL